MENSMLQLLICGMILSMCGGAEILMLAPLPTRSHYQLSEKLALFLINRGHHITLISPYKQPKPVSNLTEIMVDNLYQDVTEKVTGKSKPKSLLEMQFSPWTAPIFMRGLSSVLSRKLLEDPGLQKLIKGNGKFDLLISEGFVIDAVTSGLAYKYQVPTVAICPTLPHQLCNFLLGNPAPASYVPDVLLGFSLNMNFFERVINTVYGFYQELAFHLGYLPSQDSLMREYFGEHLPHISEIMKNTSAVLVQNHFSLTFPRPNLPNMVEIGGFHINPPKPLPQDLRKYMDESKNGVILFSMGSHLKSDQMPKETIEDILMAFSKFEQNVLWKFDGELSKLPPNVKLMKWLPQTDLLAHPNLKLFVTHGGMSSIIEAIAMAVPIVGIPVMGDQIANVRYACDAGIGVSLELNDLNVNSLSEAMKKVLSNPRYKEKVRAKSEILKDRPLNPLDLAAYWIEYIIRHDGAPHLRSAAQDLKWYELYMLDVFAFLLSILSVTLFLSVYLIKCLCRRLLRCFAGGPSTVHQKGISKKIKKS